MRRGLSLLLRAALVVGCLAYAFWDADLEQLGQALRGFDPVRMGLMVLALLAGFGLLGVRLRFLCNGRCTVADGAKASLLGLGLNNVLPAKLGEVAKAVFLSRHSGLTTGQAMGAVFWERFFDVQSLLVFILLAAAVSGRALAVAPTMAAVAVLWGGVLVLRLAPAWARRIIGLLPGERLRRVLHDTSDHIREQCGGPFFVGLSLWSALVWLQYFAMVGGQLVWMAELPLSLGQVLVVFAISSMGMAVPASPGAMGVYEAAMVFALGLYGVDRERALATALVMHLIQYLPTTILGLLFFAGSGLQLQRLKSPV